MSPSPRLCFFQALHASFPTVVIPARSLRTCSVVMAAAVTDEQIFLHQSAALWMARTTDSAGRPQCYWCRNHFPRCYLHPRPHFFFPLCRTCWRTRYCTIGEPPAPTAWDRTRTKVFWLTPRVLPVQCTDLITDYLK